MNNVFNVKNSESFWICPSQFFPLQHHNRTAFLRQFQTFADRQSTGCFCFFPVPALCVFFLRLALYLEYKLCYYIFPLASHTQIRTMDTQTQRERRGWGETAFLYCRNCLCECAHWTAASAVSKLPRGGFLKIIYVSILTYAGVKTGF